MPGGDERLNEGFDDGVGGDIAPAGAGPRRDPRVRTMDFSQPTKFSTEQQRRVARALDGFCQTASTRLSSELRTPIEMEVRSSAQLAWLMAQRQLPSSSLAITLEVSPTKTRMLLSAELSFVLAGIECLLGGSAKAAPEPRRLSEIDWVLIRRLIDAIVAQLSAVWQELAQLELEAGEIELQNEAVQIASVSEPTLAFTIETRLGGRTGTMSLLIPWTAIDPVADALSGPAASGLVDHAGVAMAIEHAVSEAEVTLRAEVAGVDLAVSEILALAPGSIVRLGASADTGVSLVVGGRLLARCQPGRRGRRLAVQIESVPAASGPQP
jgi:flagellar motor switch protein FliM